MSVVGKHGEAMDEEEDCIKSTRIKNKFLSLGEDYPSQREVKAVCQKLCEVQVHTMTTMEELC